MMQPSRPRAAVLALGAIASIVCVVAGLAAAASHVSKVSVKVGDTSLHVTPRKVKAGKVEFVVKNIGKKAHTFAVAGKTTGVLKPGKTKVLTVTFAKSGTYTFHVTLYKGRKGSVAVSGATSSGGGSGSSSAAVAAGKSIFKANCSSCHTLAAAGAKGTVGPNLDRVKLALSKIETQVAEGGRFMPPFGQSAGGSLTAAQVKDVSQFVYSAEHS